MAVTDIDRAEADRLTRTLASVGLDGVRLSFPDRPLAPWPWKELVSRVQLHRLAGLLAAAVHGGLLPATDEQQAESASLHADMMELGLHLESDLVETATIFDRAGVAYRVLKGPAFAHLDYPDPSLRAFGDIDLLVRSDQYDAAVAALTAESYARRYREVRPGFDRRFGKGASLSRPGGRQIDLHRTFVMGPFGLTIDLGDLWATERTFVLAGRTFCTLDADQRFLHACYHAAIGNVEPHLVPLRDLVGMIQRSSDPVDLDRAFSLSRRWGGQAVVARAVRVAWSAFDLEETGLSRWATGYHTTPRDGLALRTYLDPSLGYAARSLTALRAVRGIRRKGAFALALAFPDRSYGSGRHRGSWQRWRSAGRQIAALRRSGAGP